MSQIVRDFYNGDVEREWRRLDEPLGQIEFASTARLIEKYFPSAGQVCDIGAGPGRYSVLLAQQGHRVTVVELSDALLARAMTALSDCGVSAERFLQADACALRELPSAYFDAALMLGPLYHLVDAPNRLAALSELHRLLKPGGVGIVAYLNSWGILRCGLSDFPARYADLAFTHSLLGEKSYRGAVQGFTECFWATPATASREISESGFELVAYCGAEGFAGGMRPMVERVAAEEPAAFQNLVRVAAETSELPQYREATEHLHLVVRKPSEGEARRRALFEHAHPILRVADMSRSLRYYTEVLGFTNAAWGGDDFTCVSRDGASIYLSQGDQGQPGTWVWLGVSDVALLHEEYAASGATILEPPTHYGWAYEMKVQDPDGHVLRFGSEPLEAGSKVVGGRS